MRKKVRKNKKEIEYSKDAEKGRFMGHRKRKEKCKK